MIGGFARISWMSKRVDPFMNARAYRSQDVCSAQIWSSAAVLFLLSCCLFSLCERKKKTDEIWRTIDSEHAWRRHGRGLLGLRRDNQHSQLFDQANQRHPGGGLFDLVDVAREWLGQFLLKIAQDR